MGGLRLGSAMCAPLPVGHPTTPSTSMDWILGPLDPWTLDRGQSSTHSFLILAHTNSYQPIPPMPSAFILVYYTPTPLPAPPPFPLPLPERIEPCLSAPHWLHCGIKESATAMTTSWYFYKVMRQRADAILDFLDPAVLVWPSTPTTISMANRVSISC